MKISLHWRQQLSYSVSVGSVLLALVSCGQTRAEAASPTELLSCSSPSSADLGTRLVGQKLEHTFELSSASALPLRVEKVSSSCGCAVHALTLSDGATETRYEEGAPIPDRAVLRLHCEIDTTGKKAGPNMATYDVIYSGQSGVRQHLELPVKYELAPLVEFSPPVVDLGAVRPGERVPAHFDVSSAMLETFTIAPAAAGASEVEVTCTPRAEDMAEIGGVPHARRWDVSVEITPTTGSSAQRYYSIPLVVNAPGMETPVETSVFASARIVSSAYADPSGLSLGVVKRGSRNTAHFSLRSADRIEVDTAGVVIEDAFTMDWLRQGLELSFEPASDGNSITGTATVSVPVDCRSASFRCRVSIPVSTGERIPLLLYGMIQQVSPETAIAQTDGRHQ